MVWALSNKIEDFIDLAVIGNMASQKIIVKRNPYIQLKLLAIVCCYYSQSFQLIANHFIVKYMWIPFLLDHWLGIDPLCQNAQGHVNQHDFGGIPCWISFVLWLVVMADCQDALGTIFLNTPFHFVSSYISICRISVCPYSWYHEDLSDY